MVKLMKPLNSTVLFLLILFWLTPSFAATDKQLETITKLGQLNGIALQCGYIPQVQKIKQSLVLNLPKRRELGEWFEYQTNNKFMEFIKNNMSCPEPTVFSGQVELAISKLESEFAQ